MSLNFSKFWLLPLALAACWLTTSQVSAQTSVGSSGGSSGIGGGSSGSSGSSGIGTGGTTGSGTTNFAPTTTGPTQSIGGNFTGSSLGKTGTSITPPTVSNPFASYYANPYAAGLANSTPGQGNRKASTTGGKFGTPSLATVTTTQAGLAGLNQNQGAQGFSTIGLRKAPPYVTGLGEDFALPQHPSPQLQQDLRDVLLRSSTLKGQENMEVLVQNGVVILRGRALSPRQRYHAEAILRLTPGVADVVNELQVPND